MRLWVSWQFALVGERFEWQIHLTLLKGLVAFYADTNHSGRLSVLGRPVRSRQQKSKRKDGKPSTALKKKRPYGLWVRAGLNRGRQIVMSLIRIVDCRKGRLFISGGFKDPSLTGLLYGMNAVLNPWASGLFRVDVQPDFTSQALNAGTEGCCGIRPLSAIVWGIHTLFIMRSEIRRIAS